VAAHRGRFLLRFASLFKSKTSPQDLQCADDYFVYTPVIPGGKPSLARHYICARSRRGRK
jgi:hypothetical protein